MYIVEVRYAGADWADLMADMLSWLDRRRIEVEEFSYKRLGRGVAVHVSFRDGDHAAAFASSFSGRLQSAESDQLAAQEMTDGSAESDPNVGF
jgi:hypothetical protein